MINRGIAVAIGVVAATAGLVLVALMANPAQAGDPVPGLDITIEQIPGGQALLDIGGGLGRAHAYTEELHKTTQKQLGIAQELTERANRLAARGDLKGAAELAMMAADLERTVALKFKAAAEITEVYTRAITQHSPVSPDFGKQFALDYDSNRSDTSTSTAGPGATGGRQ